MIEKYHYTEKETDIVFKNLPVCYVNSFRKILISEIETFAIDYIFLEKNTSSFTDEFLVHRIGLIPLKYSKNILPEDEIELTLEVKNDTDEIMNIYSDNLQCDYDEISVMKSILLFYLMPKREIKFKCIARKGTGKYHAKWSPVVAPFLKQDENNTITLHYEYTENSNNKDLFSNSLCILEKHINDFENKIKKISQEINV